MPFAIYKRPDQGLVVEYSGIITPETGYEARNTSIKWEAKNIPKVEYAILDFSQVEKMTHSSKDVKESAEIVSNQWFNGNPNFYMAMVFTKDQGFGFGRMFQEYIGHNDRLKIFRTRDEAERWISMVKEV